MTTNSKTSSKDKPVPNDVVVIGGGPAGMMAAATAARAGARVVLLEKNTILGKKLLITGGGRCNITNNKPVVREMLSHYTTAGKFLFSPFMQHGVKESIAWFTTRNVPLVEENEGRLFPKTNQAQTVRDALVIELQKTGVQIESKSEVTKIEKTTRGFVVHQKQKPAVYAKTCIVATGGTARPETGSTGEGFAWLESLGHNVVPDTNALVPLKIKDAWIKELSGRTLEEVKVSLLQENKKHSSHHGKVLFTHVGVTGPTILNLSKTVSELLEDGRVQLQLDLFPKLNEKELKAVLQKTLVEQSNKKIRNALSALVPAAFAKVLLVELGIDPEQSTHSVSTANRAALVHALKAMVLEVSGLLGSDKAVVSAGGVVLEEVDFKTMESKIVTGLYVVGDVLNINRPSGGYSLQLCWSTGSVAGTAAAKAAI